jgi:hypothetical protein
VTAGKTHDGIFASLRLVKAGETRDWQITFIGEGVLGTTAAGVFAVGVLPKNAEYGPGAVTATPWFYNSDIKATKAVLAVQLSTLNSHLAIDDGTSLESDAAEVDRLNNLLSVSENQSVNWLLDPALISWAESLDATNPTEASATLVANLAALPPKLTQLIPYAHSDLAAILRANREGEAELAIDTTKAAAGSRNVLYAPISGAADPRSITKLNELEVQTVISNTSLRGSGDITIPALVTASANPVLVYDAAASDCLALKSLGPSNFAQLTCLTNQLAMITAESPQVARTVIVLAPPLWSESSDTVKQLVSVLLGQNWISLVGFNSLTLGESMDSYQVQPDDNQRTLTGALLHQADLLAVRTDSAAALFSDQELADGFTKSRLLGYSDLFNSNAAATNFLNRNYELLGQYLMSIQLEASDRITTPSVESEIPITIVNGSDKAVSVSVDVSSSATSRFTAKPTGAIEVASGQRVTVPVQIRLVGAGVVSVQAQLVAPNGERFGEVQNIQISSAAYSAFARTLVWGAFALLIVLALSNFIKRRKARLTQLD